MAKTKKLTVDQAQEILAQVAENIGGKLRTSYSGRGMFGAECLGIACRHDGECIEDAASLGVRGAVRDSLGLGYIVYWPQYQTKKGSC